MTTMGKPFDNIVGLMVLLFGYVSELAGQASLCMGLQDLLGIPNAHKFLNVGSFNLVHL